MDLTQHVDTGARRRPGGSRTRRRIVAAAALACGLALTACGSSTTGSASDGGTTTAPSADTSAQAAYPVTITGKLGTATIKAQPIRIVTLSADDTDNALALGVTPVGAAKVSGETGDQFAWTREKLGTEKPTLLNVDDSIPVEQVLALKPDLVLASANYTIADSYAALSKLVPVVAYETDAGVDSWQQTLRTTGKALGKSAEAETVIKATEDKIKKAAADHPDFKGKTFTLNPVFDTKGVYTVNSSDDVSAQFFRELGFTLAPAVDGLEGDGRAEIGLEDLTKIDADVVLVVYTGPDLQQPLEANAIFKSLKAVKDGGYLVLDSATANAIAFPSALSLDYALDTLVGKLAEATS